MSSELQERLGQALERIRELEAAQEDVAGLKRNRNEILAEKRTVQDKLTAAQEQLKQFEGVDLDRYRQMAELAEKLGDRSLDDLLETQRRVESQELLDVESFNAAVTSTVQELVQPKLEALQLQTDKLQSERLTRAAIAELAPRALEPKRLLDNLQLDGYSLALDDEGQVLINQQPLGDFFKSWDNQEQYSNFLKGTGGSGAGLKPGNQTKPSYADYGPNPYAKGTSNLTRRAELEQKSPSIAHAFKAYAIANGTYKDV